MIAINTNDTKQEKLRHLQQKYLASLPDRMQEMFSLWRSYRENADDTLMKELVRVVHNLAGSAGSFGLEDLSQRSRQLERELLLLGDNESSAGERHEAIRQDMETISRMVSSAAAGKT